MVFSNHTAQILFDCVFGNKVRGKAKGEAKAANERATKRRDREKKRIAASLPIVKEVPFRRD
jgi:hypothetical protein